MDAVLYLRFSTAEQADGNSENQQTKEAKSWASRNGHTLTKIYADRGISGGKDASGRKGLKQFLDDLQMGCRPSYLLVYDMDRLSRQLPLDALKLIETILSNNVTIVSLRDNQILQRDTWQSTQTFLVLTLKASLANEERAKRIHRGKDAWMEKRKSASNKLYTSKVPFWIKLENDKLIADEYNTSIVKRLFKLAKDGNGIISMMRMLNDEQLIPIIKRKLSGKIDHIIWNKATIHNTLRNRSVIGKFQPQTKIDGKRVNDGSEIDDYFPKVIDDDLFYEVQSALKSRNKCKGSTIGIKRNPSTSNLFAGIIKCKHCGASFVNLVKNKRKYHYLVCASAHKNKGCYYKTADSQVIETMFHYVISSEQFFNSFNVPDLANPIKLEIEATNKALEKRLKMIEEIDTPPKSIIQQISQLESKQIELAKKLEEAKQTNNQSKSMPQMRMDYIEQMADDLNNPDGRIKLMAKIRILVESMQIDTINRLMWIKLNGSEEIKMEWDIEKSKYWILDNAGNRSEELLIV